LSEELQRLPEKRQIVLACVPQSLVRNAMYLVILKSLDERGKQSCLPRKVGVSTSSSSWRTRQEKR
jgi:hypothetical protein